jgi:fructuronate reductase
VSGGSLKRTRLSRWAAGLGPAAPIRQVHLGPGAFFRAQVAWYTNAAGDGWGIAAVTPRSDDLVEVLGDQDGLYTVVTRGPDADSVQLVASISAVVSGRDPAWPDLLARPEVGVVTLTVTEAGYRDDSPILVALVEGLERRRRAGAGPLALVSCDNLSGNGRVLAALVAGLAERRGPDLEAFVQARCTFPNSVVDRITPATRPADLDAAEALTGWRDEATVVTEPFNEWVLQDRFPAGRPSWEAGGARFVDDVGPFQERKLRLLNAGHSLLAYVGGSRGHRYVHEAVGDPVVHQALVELWTEARRYLSDEAARSAEAYGAAVEVRWSNARLPHALAQIGADGSLKLRERIWPTVAAALAAGAVPWASARVLGAWVAHLRGASFPVSDRRAGEVVAVAALPLADAVRVALGVIDPSWPGDPRLRAAVTEAAAAAGGAA